MVRWWWRCWRRWRGRAGGWGLADSCFPSVLESSSRPVVAWESDRAKLKEVKIPPIRRSSQFVPPYPRPHQRLRPACPEQCTNPQSEVKELPPSGCDYAFSSRFSIFSPQCSSADILPPCWLSSFGLFGFCPPPRNSRLAFLKTTHTYINTLFTSPSVNISWQF